MIDPDVMYDRIIARCYDDLVRPNMLPHQAAYAEKIIKRAKKAKVMAETDPDAAWEFFTSGESSLTLVPRQPRRSGEFRF
jgi:hypothetical protein